MREGPPEVHRHRRSRVRPSAPWSWAAASAGDPEAAKKSKKKKRWGRRCRQTGAKELDRGEMKRYSDRCRDWARDCCTSGGNADVELHRPAGGGSGGGSLRITHLVGGVSSGAGGGGGGVGGHAAAAAASGAPRFPKLDECAHFHYENVELGPIQVSLCEEELKPLNDSDGSGVGNENRSWVVQVTSLGRSWLLRRSYDNFRMLDSQLHRCVYDRKFSALPELPPEANVPTANPEQSAEESVRNLLTDYLSRLSCLAGDGSAGGGQGSNPGSASLINCGPVLNWLELDNRGHRLLVTDDSDINTPAVAAAYAVRRYAAQAPDEISFEVGDMISVIDMPPPEESVWWRGKRGFEVGFFPCECVALIGEKVPRSLLHQLVPAASQQNSLANTSAPSATGATGPTSPAGTTVAPTVATPASSCASTASSSPSPASSGIIVASPSSGASVPLPSKPVLRKHGKLIAFFRSFILSRPSRRRLKQSGILKERVFGCDLGEHLLNSGHDIPMVLKCCAEFIETNGIVDGIYRLSGVTSNIQKLRNAFDEDRVPGLYEDEAILQDIHSVASLLKMYFRELPNPLCTYHLYHRFVSAVQAPHDSRLSLMREVVKSLPPPHYRTLEYLMKHLARVAQRGGDTGMTPRNVAIVWAPNLLRCKELEVGGVAALQGVGVQAVVTEFLVCYADLIFGGSDKSGNLMGQRLRQQRPLQHLSPDQHKLPPGVSPRLVAAFAEENATSTPKRSRPKSLAISTPTKLLSLEEARTRALLAATGKADQEYIEVGGGPANLPAKYHTVIDMPARKRGSGSLKSKRSPGLGWKSFFLKKGQSQAQRQQSTSSLPSKRSAIGGGVTSCASTTASTTQEKAMTESDIAQSKRRLRPVKSAESLSSAVASAGSSTRNSAALDLEIGLGSIEGVLDQITGHSTGLGLCDDRRASSPSTTGKPSHSRSVSHDSYFDHLAEPLMLLTEEDDGREDDGQDGSGNLEEEGLLDLSEIQLDFELEEREMRIFSEDETLVSTTPIGSGGSLSRSPLLPHPSRRRLMGSPQGTGPRARPEDTGSSADPSPKKKKSGASTVSPGVRKRSKVEARVPVSKSPASSSPSPASSPMRSTPYSVEAEPPSIPSLLRRSGYSQEEEEEEEELRYIDSQSPEPPPVTGSFHHRESPASYGSLQSSRGSWPSQNHHYHYQQQQMLVHAEVHPSPSEDASSVSRADATVSDNESFTVHGGETSSEGDLPAEALSVAEPLPEDEEEEEEEEGGVGYAPLVNDATAETTPVDISTPAYENVSWVHGQSESGNIVLQNKVFPSEKKKCPTASPRNLDTAAIGRVYQNIHSNFTECAMENGDGVYEDVQINNKQPVVEDSVTSESRRLSGGSATNISSDTSVTMKLIDEPVTNGKNMDPEVVYMQVKAFRKSVQEVNEILDMVYLDQNGVPIENNQGVASERTPQSSGEALIPNEQKVSEMNKVVREENGMETVAAVSNGAVDGSADCRLLPDDFAQLRTISGRSGVSHSSGNNSRRSSLPVSPSPSSLEDSHRRKFDSEIGRDILRERRVRLELERVRGEPGSGVSSPASSEGTGTRLSPSPVATPVRTLSPASNHSPMLNQSPVRTLSPAPSQSPIPSQSSAHTQSTARFQSPVPSSNSPAPRQSPVPGSPSPNPRHSPLPPVSPLPPSQSPVPRQSPVPPSQSPIPRQSPVPPSQSPIPLQSPIPRNSPVPPASSPVPKQSPVSPLTPVQPMTQLPSPLAPSPTRTTLPPTGASVPKSPVRSAPNDLPSGISLSNGSPLRTGSGKKASTGSHSPEEDAAPSSIGNASGRVTPKSPSPKRDAVIFRSREDGFGTSPTEGGYKSWGSEGGSLRGLPGRSWSVSDSRRLAVRKASVRELLSRFEGKDEGGEEEAGGEVTSGRRASAPSHRRPTPPCLRARANRAGHASSLSVSLDEERFLASAREKVTSPSQCSDASGSIESTPKGSDSSGQLIRVRTSPDINKETEADDDQGHLMNRSSDSQDLMNNRGDIGDGITPRTKSDVALGSFPLFPDHDDPERRERIERYKRERRSFLREKYRSESFRGEKDEVLKRLKEKVASVPQEEVEGGSGMSDGDSRSRRRTRRAATDGDCSEMDSQFSPTIGLLSSRTRRRAASSESDDAADAFCGPRVGVSPVMSRSPSQRHGAVPTSPTSSSIGTPSPGCIRDVAALFEARERGERAEKSDKARELSSVE